MHTLSTIGSGLESKSNSTMTSNHLKSNLHAFSLLPYKRKKLLVKQFLHVELNHVDLRYELLIFYMSTHLWGQSYQLDWHPTSACPCPDTMF
jgi:hypothetical protein